MLYNIIEGWLKHSHVYVNSHIITETLYSAVLYSSSPSKFRVVGASLGELWVLHIYFKHWALVASFPKYMSHYKDENCRGNNIQVFILKYKHTSILNTFLYGHSKDSSCITVFNHFLVNCNVAALHNNSYVSNIKWIVSCSSILLQYTVQQNTTAFTC